MTPPTTQPAAKPRSEFVQGLFEHYGGPKQEQPPPAPAAAPKAGAKPGTKPSAQAQPKPAPPTPGPKITGRTPFVEGLFKYQTEMNKLMQKTEKDLRKEEDRIAKESTIPQADPLAKANALKGLQPTPEPPVTIPQGGAEEQGVYFEQNQPLLDMIPQDLQPQMQFIREVNPFHQFPTEVANWMETSPYGQLFVGPGTQRGAQMIAETIPMGRFLNSDVQLRWKNAPVGVAEDIPVVQWLKQIAPTPQKAVDLYDRLSGQKKGPLLDYFKSGGDREETRVSMLSHEARLLLEWMVFPYALKATNKNKILGADIGKLVKDTKFTNYLKQTLARMRAKFKKATPEEESVMAELKDFVDNTGKTLPYKSREGQVLGEKTTTPDRLYKAEEVGGRIVETRPEFLTGEAAQANMPKWTQGDIYQGRPIKRPVEPVVTREGPIRFGSEEFPRITPEKRTGFGMPEQPPVSKLIKRGPREQPPGAGRAAEELVTEPAPSIIKPGETKPGGPILKPGEQIRREFPKKQPPAHGKTGIGLEPGRKTPLISKAEELSTPEIDKAIRRIEQAARGEIVEMGGMKKVSEAVSKAFTQPKETAKAIGKAALRVFTKTELEATQREIKAGKITKLGNEYAPEAQIVKEQYIRMNAIRDLRAGKPVPESILKEFKGETWAKEALEVNSYKDLAKQADVTYKQVYNLEGGKRIGFQEKTKGADYDLPVEGLTKEKIRARADEFKNDPLYPKLTKEELADRAKVLAEEKAGKSLEQQAREAVKPEVSKEPVKATEPTKPTVTKKAEKTKETTPAPKPPETPATPAAKEPVQDARAFIKEVKASLDDKGNLTRGAEYYRKIADTVGDEKDIRTLYNWAKNHKSPQVRRTITEIMAEEARLRKMELGKPVKPVPPSTPKPPETPATPAAKELQANKALDDYVREAGGINARRKRGEITPEEADKLLKEAENTYRSKAGQAKGRVQEEKPETPTGRPEPRSYVKTDSKEEFLQSIDQAKLTSKGEGGMVEFEFQGMKIRVEDDPGVLEKFFKAVDAKGFKATKLRKEPTASGKRTGERPWLKKKDDDPSRLAPDETYYRRITSETELRTPKEEEVFFSRSKTRDTDAFPVMIGKRKAYSDGHFMEFRETAPKVKGTLSEEPVKIGDNFIKMVESKKYRPAKSNFETEEGVYIHTKDNAAVVDHDYFDYVRSKYGPGVQWEIGPKVAKVTGAEPSYPVKFSLGGEVKGYIAPREARSLEEIVTAYGSHTRVDITLESGGFQSIYENMRAIIKKGGGKFTAYNAQLISKNFPNGIIQFESPYTASTLNIVPEKLSEKAIKNLLLENYKAAKAGGAEIIKKWPEGESFIAGPTVTDDGVTLGINGLQKGYEEFMKILKGVGKKTEYQTRKYKGKEIRMARSVNLEKQEIAENLKAFQAEVGALAPKSYQSWDTSQELADEIMQEYYKTGTGKIMRIFNKVKRGEGLNTQELLAVRQVNVNNVSRLKEIADTASPEKFNEHFTNYVNEIFKLTSQASSEVGRALNIHKKSVSINRMANAFTKLKRGLRPRELEEFKALNFENPYEVNRFIKRLGDPKLQDYIFEYWYNQILSGPPTHLVNTISNTVWAMHQVPHRALAGGLDAMFGMLPGYQRKVFASEIFPMLGGYKTGFLKGKAGAMEMIRTGRILEFESKIARDMGHNIIGAFERSPYKALRDAAPYISAPTRVLRAMDVWANSMAYDAQLAALARRAGLQKGLKGAQLTEFTNTFLKDPPRTALEEAAKFAKYSTFMDDPGKITRGFAAMRKTIPFELGRIIVPFVNTIGNLTKRGVEMIPGVGLTLARGQTPAEVLAKQIEGAVLSYYILTKAANGEIIGAAPENKAEREAFFREGKLPWSIKFGDTYYQFRRMEPFNTVMASAAIFYEKILKAPDEATATQMFSDYASGMYNNLLDSSYLQGVTNALDKYGQREGMVRRTAASFTPGSSFLRSTKRSYEALTLGEAKLYESKDLLGAYAQVIPRSLLSLGISDMDKKVPPRQDVFGEDIVIPGGAVRQFLPYKAAEETKDPLEMAVSKMNESLKKAEKDTLFFGMPEKEINGNELTDAQYREYVKLRGKMARIKMLPLVTSPAWKNIPLESQRRRISDRWDSAGHIARLQMKGKYPDLAKPGKFKPKEAVAQ